MKVLLFGATGMVGQGVLLECVRAQDVKEIVCVGRSPASSPSPKVANMVVDDLFNLQSRSNELSGFDACFLCLGVSASG